MHRLTSPRAPDGAWGSEGLLSVVDRPDLSTLASDIYGRAASPQVTTEGFGWIDLLMRRKTKKSGGRPLCPIVFHRGEAQRAGPPNRGRGRRSGNKHAFRLRAPLSDCYGSRPCRLLQRRGSSRGDRSGTSPIAGRRDNCLQPLSRDHAGDSRGAVRGALARHMPRRPTWPRSPAISCSQK